MTQPAGTSMKAERDQLRDRMRSLGCSLTQIALEMSRQFDLRPRLAWRHALGWTQSELAQQYNIAHPGAGLLANRVSKYETWPHGSGGPPSPRYLSGLATTYGHGCTLFRLVDVDDMEYLNPEDRWLLIAFGNGYGRDALGALREHDPAYDQLVQVLTGWVNTVGHRDALWMLSLAASVASVPPHDGE
jgi:transcriptional regulator with XRE-family HTH domain